MKLVRLLLMVPLIALLVSCGPPAPPEGHIPAKLVRDQLELDLWVEVADDPAERTQGLMGRTELGRDRGMLFVFDEPMKLAFWMKNTQIPLDILYFDENFNFVSAVSMDPCTSDPCPTYPSTKPAKYALEVNQNFVRKYSIVRGWKLVVDLPETVQEQVR